eukprot:506550-Pyramimonas_sp.AAC.1
MGLSMWGRIPGVSSLEYVLPSLVPRSAVFCDDDLKSPMWKSRARPPQSGWCPIFSGRGRPRRTGATCESVLRLLQVWVEEVRHWVWIPLVSCFFHLVVDAC